MATTIDLGGNDLIVNTLSTGATAPGQTGTNLSTLEISVLDSVTPGTVSASKALVVDSSKNLSGLGTVTMADAANFAFNVTTGTKLGTTATQKLSFYGAVPVVQPVVLASITTTQPTATVFGFTTTAQFNALIAAVNTLIANQKSLGLMATA